jgi:hypothetical protein
MSTRDVIQICFDDFAKSAGYEKKSGSWYRRSASVISILNLQKSQYSSRYFINIALWLLELGEEKYPKEQYCHLRSRIDAIFTDFESEINDLLDFRVKMQDEQRLEQLDVILRRHLEPLLLVTNTLEGLSTSEADVFIRHALVVGDAQRLLSRT